MHASVEQAQKEETANNSKAKFCNKLFWKYFF